MEKKKIWKFKYFYHPNDVIEFLNKMNLSPEDVKITMREQNIFFVFYQYIPENLF